jgi:hypothetical protein
MTTEFDLTKEDFIAFNLYHHLHSSRTLRKQYRRARFAPLFGFLLIWGGIWFLAVQQTGTPLNTAIALSPILSGAFFVLIAMPWAYRRKIKALVQGMLAEDMNRSLFSRRRITLSSDCITDSTEFTQSTTVWRGVVRLDRNDDYLFLYTSTLHAIIVPRRAFATPSDFDAFTRTANQHYTASR